MMTATDMYIRLVSGVRRPRHVGVAVLTALVAVVGAVSVAGPAHAVPAGAGWAASWEYYQTGAFEVRVDLPGARIIAFGTDINGERTIAGTVEDTNANDRLCARARVIATDAGQVAQQTVCRGWVAFQAGQRAGTEMEEALFVHLDLMAGTAVAQSTFTFLPSSAGDPDLRAAGTATSWQYVTSASYHLEVHRSGVSLYGDGAHQSPTERSVLAAVVNTGPSGTCSGGAAADASSSEFAFACEPDVPESFAGTAFVGWIKITACHFPAGGVARCLTMHFPEPN